MTDPRKDLYQSLQIPAASEDPEVGEGATLPCGLVQDWARLAEIQAKSATLYMDSMGGPDSKYFGGVDEGYLVRAIAAVATSRQKRLTERQRADFSRNLETALRNAINSAESLTYVLTREGK